MLSNPVPDRRILIESSEFARYGNANGQAHQLYIGPSVALTLRYSHIHNVRFGSKITSRAAVNRIVNNRIIDGAWGSSNYKLNLAEGELAEISDNIIEQRPKTSYSTIVAYAPERPEGCDGTLNVEYKTLVNDAESGVFVRNLTDYDVAL